MTTTAEIRTTVMGAAEILTGLDGIVSITKTTTISSGRGQLAKGVKVDGPTIVVLETDKIQEITIAIAQQRADLPDDTYKQVKASYTRLAKQIRKAI